MTFENFEEIFWLIKDDITKENTKMRDQSTQTIIAATIVFFLSAGES